MQQANLEELGLLKVLERIESGREPIELPVRVGLIQRGLIEATNPPTLTPVGLELLRYLQRLRSDVREGAV